MAQQRHGYGFTNARNFAKSVGNAGGGVGDFVQGTAGNAANSFGGIAGTGSGGASATPGRGGGMAGPQANDLIANVLDEERFKARQAEALEGIVSQREANMARGQEFVKDFSLGRLAETPFSAENARLREQLEGRSQGLNAGEGAALRETALRGLGQQQQGDIRALRGIQGGQGVRGPAAAAQQQQVFQQGADRRSDLEQQLLLRNVELQRQGTQDFQRELARQQGQVTARDQFNIAQRDREAQVKQSFPFLFAGLGAQESAAASGQIHARDRLIAGLFPDMIANAQAGGGFGGAGQAPTGPNSFGNQAVIPDFEPGQSIITAPGSQFGQPQAPAGGVPTSFGPAPAGGAPTLQAR